MPSQPTYYTDEEYAVIEQAAEEQDKSFSKIVREAVQEKFSL